MSATRPKFGSAIIISLLCVLILSPSWAAQRKSTRKAAKPAQAAPAPVPTPEPPPQPLTLAQQPATPPQVSFQNGQLTIVAQNSTLGDILHAVHRQTGANFDVPANATERVVTHLGPGPARDVLASLLNGSHFDYVMVGSPNNPSALDRVILMQKGQENEPVNQASGANPQSQPPQVVPPAENPEPNAADDFTDESADQDVQADQQQPDEQQQADQQQQQNGQPGVKTPEQLLQELQQRQQQQQQQQPNGAPTPAAPQGFPIPPGQQPQPQPQQQPPQ